MTCDSAGEQMDLYLYGELDFAQDRFEHAAEQKRSCERRQ